MHIYDLLQPNPKSKKLFHYVGKQNENCFQSDNGGWISMVELNSKFNLRYHEKCHFMLKVRTRFLNIRRNNSLRSVNQSREIFLVAQLFLIKLFIKRLHILIDYIRRGIHQAYFFRNYNYKNSVHPILFNVLKEKVKVLSKFGRGNILLNPNHFILWIEL